MVTVKVIANHHSGGEMHMAGSKREVTELEAAELKRNGLIEWSGEAAKEKATKINVTEKVATPVVIEKVQKNANGTNKKA